MSLEMQVSSANIHFSVIREFQKIENGITVSYYETERIVSDNESVKVPSKRCQAMSFHADKNSPIFVNEIYVPVGSPLILCPGVGTFPAIIDQIFEVTSEKNKLSFLQR